MKSYTLTTGDVARILGVSRNAVLRWCERGLLPCNRTNRGHRRISRADALRLQLTHTRRLAVSKTVTLAPAPTNGKQYETAQERESRLKAARLPGPGSLDDIPAYRAIPDRTRTLAEAEGYAPEKFVLTLCPASDKINTGTEIQ